MRYYRIIECALTREDGSFDSINTLRMDNELGYGAACSIAPNGKDIWISGGILQPDHRFGSQC